MASVKGQSQLGWGRDPMDSKSEQAGAGRSRRISARELTAERILTALQRRAADIPHRLAWSSSSGFARTNRERLGAFAGRHTGQRCFILGNGPSLAKMDLGPLADEVSFGLNRIYLLFDDLPFRPTYYCAANELVLEQFCDDIAALSMPRFLSWSGRQRFDPQDESILYLKQALTLNDFFGYDARRAVCSGGTVTYLAIQLAWFMGFQQVILLGVDHSFADKGVPNHEELRESAVDENHFHPDYFPKGSRWQLPDLLRSEGAYRLARDAFEAEGRQILDATVGGQLEVFEKVRFESLFEDGESLSEDGKVAAGTH
jgi:hypothetical protein